ncbi:acyl-CoA thioesterase [Plebeiibacterium sediminum]|uniref:Acyl-CoA thioesterase n=1 Tax=Plebeiibacterium sediminum TaxID=2992112 RepID=A0AAE3M6Y7_9BACT|nr:thioesterase family protein [Plebeiobacterium sediminum]MCW3787720.1 acyl-CoA thioesterase [Plebeiobacterium sediminum]
MIIDEFKLRPRYDEVDQMGYVYHANHVSYCHQARTELLRKFNINDFELEEKGYMLPVISFNIQYKVPARYDELLTIKTTIKELPKVRFQFYFEIRNQEGKLVSKANSEVVFVNRKTRVPMQVPDFVFKVLEKEFEASLSFERN